jgi:hypothetical protein
VEKEYKNDLAAKANKRLRKHRNDRWIFLHYDGMPKNNNDAEAAINPSAQHRWKVNRIVIGRRLPGYLEMLSLPNLPLPEYVAFGRHPTECETVKKYSSSVAPCNSIQGKVP